MDLIKEDETYVLNLYKRLPLVVKEAKGLWLTDEKGDRYLDFYGGIAVQTLGHNHPAVLQKMQRQMEAFMHLSNYFVASSTVSLAKLLVSHSFAKKVFFANSGTEANEAMLKLALKYGLRKSKEKKNLIALEKGFHGRTFGAMHLTGTKGYRAPFGEDLPFITHIPMNDVDALREAVDENTCGIVFEVIQGEGGLVEMEEAFALEVERLSKKFQALILVDEVQTGLYRTGTFFAHERFSLKPHAMTLAKGLGGGLPLGALLLSEEVEEVLQKGDHGSTFGGNPVACAGGVGMLETLLAPSFQEGLEGSMKRFEEGIRGLKKTYPHILTEVRGRGYMVGLVTEYAEEIKDRAFQKKLLLNVTGKNVVRLLPALTLGKHEMDVFFRILRDILQELTEERRRG
ncbi:MAG TPA: aspartate aminotransferase family protein [Clostridiaceae bacterium]|nr:aspartate aminotransferase family protein [Clostridiaceae bacterium]